MAIKKRHEEHENHERWLVSYADFITLLFAFFVVLYASSQADQEKQKKVETSIKASFGQGGDAQAAPFDELQNLQPQNIKPRLLTSFPPRGSGAAEVQGYVEKKLEQESEEGQEGGQAVTGVRHDAIGVRIQVAANRIFDSGSADLKADSGAALDKIGELLKESGRRLIIEGHTDDQPIKTALYPSNWELSASRATKIVRYLVAKHKIAASRLTAVAYADQKPLVPNTSEVNRAKNRRIEVMIVTDEKADEL
jgi:chemotaxis protein MotB